MMSTLAIHFDCYFVMYVECLNINILLYKLHVFAESLPEFLGGRRFVIEKMDQ